VWFTANVIDASVTFSFENRCVILKYPNGAGPENAPPPALALAAVRRANW